MKCDKWDIGVCSWSLQTDVDGVAAAMRDVGIEHVHLAVGPALKEGGQEYLAAVKAQDWTVSCTMISFPQEDYSTLDTIKVTGGVLPDDNWPANEKLFAGAAQVTKTLGVKYLSTHAGFIDHNDAEKYKVMCDRIKRMADVAQASGIMLLMETGQESAADLAGFMKEIDHPAVGINFDPANMILYDKGDPIEAVKILAPWIKHVHIKDANRTATTGQWGCEVPWGEGQVCSDKFLDTLAGIGYEGTLAIEREAGSGRVGDIKLAAERLRS